MNFIYEGIDRLGKDSLIKNLINELGFYQVLHRTKPESLDYYLQEAKDNKLENLKNAELFLYQRACFSQDMALLNIAELSKLNIIFNRGWLGEAVYAPLYRGYSGEYVFELEKIAGIDKLSNTRLILLTEDFSKATHFLDDGNSLGTTEKRAEEQEMFLQAFNKSLLSDKKIICVTGADGTFRAKEDILKEALE